MTHPTAWAHLPNAKHINAVLADVKARPEVWKAAWYAARDAARDAVWNVIRALVAWDLSADLLDLSPDALRTLMDVAAPPVCHQAALLLPWAIVKHTEEVTPM